MFWNAFEAAVFCVVIRFLSRQRSALTCCGLCCVVLRCIVLSCVLLCSLVFSCVVLCCIVLVCGAVHRPTTPRCTRATSSCRRGPPAHPQAPTQASRPPCSERPLLCSALHVLIDLIETHKCAITRWCAASGGLPVPSIHKRSLALNSSMIERARRLPRPA
jgi:hypothetical protein